MYAVPDIAPGDKNEFFDLAGKTPEEILTVAHLAMLQRLGDPATMTPNERISFERWLNELSRRLPEDERRDVRTRLHEHP